MKPKTISAWIATLPDADRAVYVDCLATTKQGDKECSSMLVALFYAVGARRYALAPKYFSAVTKRYQAELSEACVPKLKKR